MMEARSNNRMLMRNHFLRGTVEMVLERRNVTPRKNAAVSRASHGNHGPTPIVGSCCVSETKRGNNKNQENLCSLWAACMQQRFSI